jgi:DNA-binding beta-propeller fold protein YncE
MSSYIMSANGPVTVGGWINDPSENFVGPISSVIVYPVIASAAVSGTTAVVSVPFTYSDSPLSVVAIAKRNSKGQQSAASATQILESIPTIPAAIARAGTVPSTLTLLTTSFGSYGSGDGQFYEPKGIATDATGNIYIVDTNNNRVQKFTANGAYISKFGSLGSGDGQFNYPIGIAIDATGNICVTDFFNNRIQTFDSNGNYLRKFEVTRPSGIAIDKIGNICVDNLVNGLIQTFTSAGTYLSQFGSLGSGNGQFDNPVGIAIDATGNIYVADTSNHRIQKFTSTGTYLSQFGSYGQGNGQFYNPQGIAIDAIGNICVADTYNNRIQTFTSAGTYITQVGGMTRTNGIAISATGNIIVSDYNNVVRFIGSPPAIARAGIMPTSNALTMMSTFGSAGFSNGLFIYPAGVATDAAGNIYVTDQSINRVQKFTSTGTYLSQFGSSGTGNGQFNQPGGIAIDAVGNICVVDTGNNRIQTFTSAGTYVSQFGSYGTGSGQFRTPYALAISSTGKIIVTEYDGSRIQIVGPEPGIGAPTLGTKASTDGAYLIPMPAGASTSYGTTWVEPGEKLFVQSANNYNTGGHLIGYNVAISSDGNQMVIGSPYFDGSSYVNSSNYGVIQMYRWGGASWTLSGTDSGSLGDKLGEQVAISGDGKVVAATVNAANGVGQIKLYKNSAYYGTLNGVNYSVYSVFGTALSLSGNGRWLALSGNTVSGQNINYTPGYIKVIDISNVSYAQWGQDILGPDSTNARLGTELIISADGNKLVTSTVSYLYGGNGNYNKIVVYAKPSTSSGSWNNIWVKENNDIVLSGRGLSASYDLSTVAFTRYIGASPYTPTTYIYNTTANTLINTIVRSYGIGYGFDLALSGDGNVIAQFEATNGSNYSVYVYDTATLTQIGNTMSRSVSVAYNCISLSGEGTRLAISVPNATTANPGGEVSVYQISRTNYVEYTSSNSILTPIGKTSLIAWDSTITSGTGTITATQYINGISTSTSSGTITLS